MNIYQKLIEVRKSCTYLKKDTKGYQFPYVTSSQTLGTLRGKMDELGLLLVPKVLDNEVYYREWTDDDGKRKFAVHTSLAMEYTWINADSPEETVVCPFYAQGVDTGERGVGKALTYGEKYFLLKFFNIATDKDDPDSFQAKHQEEQDPLGANVGTKQELITQIKETIEDVTKGDPIRTANAYKGISAKLKRDVDEGGLSKLTKADLDIALGFVLAAKERG